MPKLHYPIKPWLIQWILNGQTLKSARTLQVLQHFDGPLDDGTMIKIVGDGAVIMKGYFPKSAYENLEDTQQECWERSLIRITDWDINLTLLDTKETSDYMITINTFDVWSNEEGFKPKVQLKPCKFDSRIAKKISDLWEEKQSCKRAHENLRNSDEEDGNMRNSNQEDENMSSDEEAENLRNSDEEAENLRNSDEEAENLRNSDEEDENMRSSDEEGENLRNSDEEGENLRNSDEEAENLRNSDEEDENLRNSDEEDENMRSSDEEAENLRNSDEEDENLRNSDEEDENMRNLDEEAENLRNSDEENNDSSTDGSLTLLVKEIGDECFTQTENSAQRDMLLNHGSLKTISIEDLQTKIMTLYSEDFVIKPEEKEILEAIPEWYQDSVQSTSSVFKRISDRDNEIELQQATTMDIREPCANSIVPQPSTSDPCTSSEFETIPGNLSDTVVNQIETNPEGETHRRTILQDDITMTTGLCLPKKRQSDNNLLSEDVSLPSQSNPRITSQSNDYDIDSEEETRLHNLALPSREAADQYDIQQAKQHKKDCNANEPLCSQDTLLKVTSTDNDEHGFSSSLEFSSCNDSNRSSNVLNKSCDSSQQSNSNNETNCPGPSVLVSSTAHESCHLSPTKHPSSSEMVVFNYNADSNFPVPQIYSSKDSDSDNVNFNPNEVVTSTAKEVRKPELRSTYLLKSKSNKRAFSTYQMDSIDNISDYTESPENSYQFNISTYATPSKRKHTELQDNTDQNKLDALKKLKSLLKIPLITADQKITASWSLPENILTEIKTYWSNTSHHSIQ